MHECIALVIDRPPPPTTAVQPLTTPITQSFDSHRILYECFISGELSRDEYNAAKSIANLSAQPYQTFPSNNPTANAKDTLAVQSALQTIATTKRLTADATDLLIKQVRIHPNLKIEVAWKTPLQNPPDAVNTNNHPE